MPALADVLRRVARLTSTEHLGPEATSGSPLARLANLKTQANTVFDDLQNQFLSNKHNLDKFRNLELIFTVGALLLMVGCVVAFLWHELSKAGAFGALSILQQTLAIFFHKRERSRQKVLDESLADLKAVYWLQVQVEMIESIPDEDARTKLTDFLVRLISASAQSTPIQAAFKV